MPYVHNILKSSSKPNIGSLPKGLGQGPSSDMQQYVPVLIPHTLGYLQAPIHLALSNRRNTSLSLVLVQLGSGKIQLQPSKIQHAMKLCVL